MTLSVSSLLYLVRIGIHSDVDLAPMPADVDWATVVKLASAQKVTAIVMDGYSRLFDAGMVTVDMDKSLKKQWIGQVIQSYEWKYPTYRATIGHLASVYARHGIRMMVLKGYVLLEPELSCPHASPLRGRGLLELRGVRACTLLL